MFKYQLLLLSLSLSLGFFYMLVIQMRILRINGVNCHKNGHMCVIEVERKITSLFYVNSYIYIYFWIKNIFGKCEGMHVPLESRI